MRRMVPQCLILCILYNDCVKKISEEDGEELDYLTPPPPCSPVMNMEISNLEIYSVLAWAVASIHLGMLARASSSQALSKSPPCWRRPSSMAFLLRPVISQASGMEVGYITRPSNTILYRIMDLLSVHLILNKVCFHISLFIIIIYVYNLLKPKSFYLLSCSYIIKMQEV